MDCVNSVVHRRRKNRTRSSSSARKNGSGNAVDSDASDKKRASFFERKEPIIPRFIYLDKEGFPEPDECRNPFFGKPTAFPKPNMDQLELPESLPRNLQLAVQKSIVQLKLKRIQDRFEQLAIAAGVTEAELHILRETKYDRSVFEDFLNNRWREANGRVAFGKAREVTATWVGPNGEKGATHRELTLPELYAWKCKEEDKINNMSLEEVSKDQKPEVDWKFVSCQLSNVGEGNWSAQRCKNLYEYNYGPHIRHLPSWTPEDLHKFRKIIASSRVMDFTKIAKEMGKGFTPVVCFKAYMEDKKLKSRAGLSSSSSHNSATNTRRYLEPEDEESDETSSDSSTCDETSSGESSDSDEADIRDVLLNFCLDPTQLSSDEEEVLVSNLTGKQMDIVNSECEEMVFSHMAEKNLDLFSNECSEEFVLHKKTPFTDVEDAILLVAAQQFKQCRQTSKDLKECKNVNEWLFLDVSDILPWREDDCVERRLNTLFRRQFVIPWSIEEDQLLLRFTWLYPKNWTKISTYFHNPYRNPASLDTRLTQLKKYLQFYTLNEFHRFVYSNSYEVRNYIQRPYTLLKRALACLESLLESRRRREDWVSKYTAIYAPLKRHEEIDKELISLRAQIGNPGHDVRSEKEPEKYSECKRHVSTYSEMSDKSKTRVTPQSSLCQRQRSNQNSHAFGPPGHAELIRYLWNTDTKYITQACDFIVRFLESERVSPALTEVELLDYKWRHKRNGYNRDNSKCVAAAAYCRKIDFKSDVDLIEQQIPLTPFEESTLSWHKWYSKTRVLKRTVKRNIPEKAQLLLYPELQNLLHEKYGKPNPKKIKVEVKSEIKCEPEDVKNELDMNELWALVPVNSPTPAQEVPPHDDHCMDTAQGVPWTTTTTSSNLETKIAVQLSSESDTPTGDSGYVSPAASFPTLKTVSSGRGKKASRKSNLRREVAKARWAKRKSAAAESTSEKQALKWTDGISLVLVQQ